MLGLVVQHLKLSDKAHGPWGSFGALVSKWPVSLKQLAVERNVLKFGNTNSYMVYL